MRPGLVRKQDWACWGQETGPGGDMRPWPGWDMGLGLGGDMRLGLGEDMRPGLVGTRDWAWGALLTLNLVDSAFAGVHHSSITDKCMILLVFSSNVLRICISNTKL